MGVVAFLLRGAHSIRAQKVIGSPFNTFADAEGACKTTLGTLERVRRVHNGAQANSAAPLSVNFR